MLRRAAVDFEIVPARIDETAIKVSLAAEGAKPRDIADALAEAKARKVSGKRPEAVVLGSDQVLDFEGAILSKPESPEEAFAQISRLRGKSHKLYSAAVIYEEARPVWRNVGQVRLSMRDVSDEWLADYVERNWNSIRHSVGGYKLEEEGVRLFNKIEGDHFNVLGMPLLDVLSYLSLKGTLRS